MRSSVDLLTKAEAREPVPYWTKKLALARNTLNNSRQRGHLSPAIAFALADELGENPMEWAVIAAAESEKDSACKRRMLKTLGAVRKLYLSALSRARSVVGKRAL